MRRWEWALLILLALAGAILWSRFALPRYQAIDLAVNQAKAVQLAKDYLREKYGDAINGYEYAAIFNVDNSADRYLQKTLGVEGSKQLLNKLDYDLFFWTVRFFKEKHREEYKVSISAKTGKVIEFLHDIKDTDARPITDKDTARATALAFLKQTFGFDPNQDILYRDDTKKFDHRVNYTFTWQAKDVSIPWDKSKGGGNAKLLTTVVISGDEILYFDRYQLDIPEGFDRYVDNLKQTGDNLTLIFRLIYLALLTTSIVVVVNRKHHLVPRMVKPFYVGVGITLFALLCLDMANGYQYYLFYYPTPQSFAEYVFRQFIQNLINPFFIVVALILPALAGESLSFYKEAQKKHRGFLSLILSSFYTRSVADQICIGYCVAAFVLGLQALIFSWGYHYLGVWDEFSWLTQASTGVFPALTALLIGFQASFTEEIMFRLYAINLLKRYGLPTAVAIFLSAVMWGFGHTGYAIFPMWFRGVEVTCLGLVLGFAYWRYGLITTLTAHFLMDSFLTILPYLRKPELGFDFFSSLGVLALPAFLAIAAFVLNRSPLEKSMTLQFNPHQQFNYELLRQLISSKEPQQLKAFRQELLHHGWDPAVVSRAFENL